MRILYFFSSLSLLTCLYACENQQKQVKQDTIINTAKAESPKNPVKQDNSNKAALLKIPGESTASYLINIPEGWTTRDTVFMGASLKYMISTKSPEGEAPHITVLLTALNGANVEDYTSKSMAYMKEVFPDAVSLGEDAFKTVDSIHVRWFSYSRKEGGVERESVCYVISLRDYAYIITGATNKGYLKKYRELFDQTAQSFRVEN